MFGEGVTFKECLYAYGNNKHNITESGPWLNPFSLLYVRLDFDWVHRGGPRANLRGPWTTTESKSDFESKPRSKYRVRSNYIYLSITTFINMLVHQTPK